MIFPVLITYQCDYIGVAATYDGLLRCVRETFSNQDLQLVDDNWTTSHGRGWAVFEAYPNPDNLPAISINLFQVDIYADS